MEAQHGTTALADVAEDGFPRNIHRTKVPLKELKPETLEYLTNWKKPNGAYILFEKRQFHLGRDMQYTAGTGLMTLSVEARPEQESKLGYYVFGKGFRIIDFGNFPSLNDKDPRRQRRAQMYSGHNGANPWDSLARTILGMMQTNPNWREEKAKYDAELEAARNKEQGLAAKVAALEAENARLKNGENTTNSTSVSGTRGRSQTRD